MRDARLHHEDARISSLSTSAETQLQDSRVIHLAVVQCDAVTMMVPVHADAAGLRC